MIKRVMYTTFAVILIGFGISMSLNTGFGVDPTTSLAIGLTMLFSTELGITSVALNFVLLIPLFFIERKRIGYGTIANIILVGTTIQFFSKYLPMPNVLYLRLLMLAVGVVLTAFGVAIYILADLGQSPIDSLPYGYIRILGHGDYGKARLIQDVIVTIIAFSLGATISLGTVIFAFFLGPIIQLILNILKQYDNLKIVKVAE